MEASRLFGYTMLFVLAVIAAIFFWQWRNSSSDMIEIVSEHTYEYSSVTDEPIVGWARVEPQDDGIAKLKWVFVFTDSTLVNNGECIDRVGDFCEKDPDGSRAALAITNYRYGASLASTAGNDYVAAMSIEPVYCNQEAVLADISQYHLKSNKDRIDFTCDKNELDKWEPTDTFIVIGSTRIENLLDSSEPGGLTIYDTHRSWVYTADNSDTSERSSLGLNINSNQIIEQPLVTAYDIVATEITETELE